MEDFGALQTQIAEMVARGHEPAAIVMTPLQMKYLFKDMVFEGPQGPNPKGSGYTFAGLPIYRSWRMSGPTVIDEEVLRALLNRYCVSAPLPTWKDMPDGAAAVADLTHDPILF